MSTFEVKVVQVRSIEPIPDADAIELAVIGEYRSVVKKGDFVPGQYAVYIPEASLIPATLLEKMGLTGKLAGPDKNRVKAIRLRGCLSQGILYPVYCTNPFAHGGRGQHEIELGLEEEYSMSVDLGDDVSKALGITKWEPAIPVSMSGEVYNAGQHITYNYDIENFKWHPEVLQDGEEVQFTEKLHGTFCQLIYIPTSIANNTNAMHENHLRVTGDYYDGYFALASKGLGGQGLCFKWGDPEQYNVYQKAVIEYLPHIAFVLEKHHTDVPVMIMGEVFGDGIQDLHYGMKNTFSFRVFDIRVGYRDKGYFIDDEDLDDMCFLFGIPRVPVVYRGPFTKEIMLQYTHHKKSQLDENQLSEGIVVKPTKERIDPSMGRVVLKSINEDYLMRKNKNATEYQ